MTTEPEVQRWALGDFREFTYESKLCPQHKLMLLSILSFMSPPNPTSFPNYTTLSMRASVSRSLTSTLVRELATYDWVVIGKAERRSPGPKPNLYMLPRRDLVPQVPPHCSRRRGRIQNLMASRKTNAP